MLDPGFTTPEMADVFTPAARVGAMLEFEAALALALADTGFVDMETARALVAACSAPVADPDAVLAATWSDGTPLRPLLEGIRSRLPDDLREWAHYGATTQDTIDTATMLQARKGLEVLDTGLIEVAGQMAETTIRHRDQPHMGRTFLQHARPTTFGFTVAGWLDATLAHVSELREARRGLAVQCGGPVGNLSAFGDRGSEVVAALAKRLGLAAPALPWHSDRSRVSALAAGLERATRTMARVGIDVALLASSDVAEIRVRGGGSSSMAGKQNPMDSVRAAAAAELCTAAAGAITGARLSELERGIGGWHVEWAALPLVFQTTAAAVEAIASCLAGLEVKPEVMGVNVPTPEIDPRLIDGVIDAYQDLTG
ncbi:MAG TPA: lyase family protein [Acidimicrobiia bacterium]|nr:lyase family protein [Acidimicrobiia bacterium]